MLQNFPKIASVILAVFATVALFAPPVAAATPTCKDGTVLTFPTWYRGLARNDDCRVKISQLSDAWIIGLNLMGVLLQAVAYAAVGYIIWGGFRYMKSRGDPGRINDAKNTITDAILGLGISLASVAIVGFVVRAVSGNNGNAATYNLPNAAATVEQLGHVLNGAVFPVAGVVAVIFIIIGAIQFMTSYGDPASIKRARETLIYSVVGLVVVIMAFAIVQFMLGRFSS
jgi:hypothetical protein